MNLFSLFRLTHFNFKVAYEQKFTLTNVEAIKSKQIKVASMYVIGLKVNNCHQLSISLVARLSVQGE